MSIKLIDVYEDISFPVQKKDLFILDEQGNAINNNINQNAIIRSDTNEVLSVMSKRYNLVPHREMLDKAVECLDRAQLEYKIDKCKLIDSGAQIWIEFTLPEYQMNIGGEDKVDFRLIFKNSYNGTWSFDFSCGFFRLVCSNGLTIGKILEKIKKKHTPNLNVTAAVENIMLMIEKTHTLGLDRLTTMAQNKISIDKGKNIIDTLFENQIWPRKYQELVKMNYVNKIYAYTNDSLFDVYNAFSRELNDMEERGLHIGRLSELNMKAFEGVWSYTQ